MMMLMTKRKPTITEAAAQIGISPAGFETFASQATTRNRGQADVLWADTTRAERMFARIGIA
jgi:hypothetical protein